MMMMIGYVWYFICSLLHLIVGGGNYRLGHVKLLVYNELIIYNGNIKAQISNASMLIGQYVGL